MKRLVFIRDDATEECYSWISELGGHSNLEHKLIASSDASIMKFSFVVVDAQSVLVSLPGYETLDEMAYSGNFILRHLIEINDEKAAKVYERIHKELWSMAVPCKDYEAWKSKSKLQALAKSERT